MSIRTKPHAIVLFRLDSVAWIPKLHIRLHGPQCSDSIISAVCWWHTTFLLMHRGLTPAFRLEWPSSSHRGTDCHRVQTLLCRKDAAQTWLSAFSEPPAHRVQQDEKGGPVAVSGTKPSCAMCPYPWTPFDMQPEMLMRGTRRGLSNSIVNRSVSTSECELMLPSDLSA